MLVDTLQSRSNTKGENLIKHVFVCGLHRSGTTALARDIGKLKDSTVFENTGAVMDEGQYLQDVYPPAFVYGGVGRFGFAHQSHLTESAHLLTPANISRLRESWEKYWDTDKSIRIEKTPSNLLMTRFLQAAFPNAYFVVVKRHPVPVSLATQKWSRSSLHSLFEHWLHCHRIFEGDLPYLERVYELSYEDYIDNPTKYLEEIAKFVGTECDTVFGTKRENQYNQKYFDQWNWLLRKSRGKLYYRHVAKTYESRFAQYGYSLGTQPEEAIPWYERNSVVSRIIWRSAYLGFDLYAVLCRADLQWRNKIQQLAHQYFPKKLRQVLRSVKTKI
jgi:hypothetical protein